MTRYFPDDDVIARLVCRFLDHSLPKAEWTHAAHFAATLWLLRQQPLPPLSERMPGLIRAYNEAVGGVNNDTAGYHETITQASIAAARDFLGGRSEKEPLHEVVDHLMASPLGHPDWLLTHWSQPRLFSIEARRAWRDPDLQALPFPL